MLVDFASFARVDKVQICLPFGKLVTKNMRVFICSALFLSFSITCSCDSRMQVKKWIKNDNRNGLECLESLIDVVDWVFPNFLIISDQRATLDSHFIKRHPNFQWLLLNSGGKYNLTGYFNVILFAENFDKLNETLSAISTRHVGSQVKFVISVTKDFGSFDEIQRSSKWISAVMWKLDITRVVYLIRCKEDILAMTYFPFARNCQVGDLEVLDVWRGKEFAKKVQLFPEKMLDIRGCVRNHSAIFDEGLVLQLQKEFTETGEMILGGVAGRLITIVAEKMNMDLRLLPEKPQSWTVLINQIMQDKALFSIAGNMPIASRLETLNQDFGYMEETFGFGYVIGGYEVSWKNLVWPLTIDVWVYVGSIILLFSGLILLANRFENEETSPEKFEILDSFGIFLATSRGLPRSYFKRYLIGMWITYSFFINAFYNCGLVSFLTTPNEKRVINTLEELLADGMDFGGGLWHREFYHDPSDPVMMEIYKNFKVWSEEESENRLKNRQGATGVLTSYVRIHNSNQSNIDHRLRILQEKTLTYHVPISMRRGSPFVFGVHYYTLQIIQSGLLDYWLKYYTRILRSAFIGAQSPSGISTQHLRGILYLYITGLICSFVVFLGELVLHKYSS